MQELKDNSLFTELTSEESASVNGGHYYRRYRSSRYDNCYSPRRRIVYRRNCDGSYRRVVRYW
jgi:hypothetical protein